MSIVNLAGFKQTYWSGHHHTEFAEPALSFPTTQSPSQAIKVLGGNTRDKWILCTVPKSAPTRDEEGENPYAGLMYAIVQVWAVERTTKTILAGYPAPKEVLARWIEEWPRCLPIRKWYDIREPRPFEAVHPDANDAAKKARGRLWAPEWLTGAARLQWADLVPRQVFVTPAIREIHSLLDN